MQRMTGLLRRCVEDYNMIEEGDRIAIGVSGGKDSLTLLRLMAALREYYPKHFEIEAFTIDLGLEGMDFSPVQAFCDQLKVPYTIVKTEIGPIIFVTAMKRTPALVCKDAPGGPESDHSGKGHP